MTNFEDISKVIKETSGVKTFVAANADGQAVASHNAADPDTLASAVTLMLMGAAAVGATLGIQGPEMVRLAARNREDLLLFIIKGGGIAVQKTAQANGTEFVKTIFARIGEQNSGDGE